MYSSRLYSPLRYPGGKARFAPFITNLIQANGLAGGVYCEPYAGGAGVALDLLFHGVASEVHINDADPAVSAFWRAATQHTHGLIDLVMNAPLTMDDWHHWRNAMLTQEEADPIKLGFATLFMNRTSRSGILKGGVIGGKQQQGSYKLHDRFDREMLAKRLLKIGQHAKAIHVHQEDALALLGRCHRLLPANRSLIYLDPPYYVKGQGLYRNYYHHGDHEAIARTLQSKRFNRHWIVSYDDAPQIHAMYSGATASIYQLNYSAQKRYHGSEAMFFDPRLFVKDVLNTLAA